MQRYRTVPGVGPITAFAGDSDKFKNGREFAAWIGLTPLQHSTGGKEKLGSIKKMGQRDLCTLLLQGAMLLFRHRCQSFEEQTATDQRLLSAKRPKQVAVAWANRHARILWELYHRKEDYDPAKAASCHPPVVATAQATAS